MDVRFRWANIEDLDGITEYVDCFLSGRRHKTLGRVSASDYFVEHGRHIHYIKDYKTLLAVVGQMIVGWAVLTSKGVLIHLLVRPDFRGRGIGRRMVEILQPELVRSKTDQSSGNPEHFYRTLGYVPSKAEFVGRKRNIQLFIRDVGGTRPAQGQHADGIRPLQDMREDGIQTA